MIMIFSVLFVDRPTADNLTWITQGALEAHLMPSTVPTEAILPLERLW